MTTAIYSRIPRRTTSADTSPDEDRIFLLALNQRTADESSALTNCPSCGTVATASSSYCWACGDPMTSSDDQFADDDWYSWA